ncbi:MAG: TrkA family potassium uptake protein [Verrucomicrobia bacterium]|nr:TrkA family potassium uptake protein [Verrucomicrobiota bacterium]
MAQRIFVLGAGRFGIHLATRLSEYGCEVVIGDRNPERVKDLAEDGFHAVEMDADDEDASKDAGVVEADVVVVSIGDNMQGSILATLLLKDLKARRIIARALDVKHAQVLEKVGADLVVLPSRDMAYRLAERLRDDASSDRQPISGDYQMAQIRVGPPVHGKTLAELTLRERYRINVVLVARCGTDGTTEHLEPEPRLKLALHDLCIIVGKRDNLNRFERECGAQERR